jgi:hypothetical protein
MLCSGMLRHVALIRADVSKERSDAIIRVTRIGELGTTLAGTSNRCMILVTLMMEAICSSKTLVLTRATWCNIPEDGILHSHCHENLRPHIFLALRTCFPTLTLPQRTNTACDEIIPADALESVDCWEPSSNGAPSGPVVTTDVTVPGVAGVTFAVVPAT